MPERFVEHPYHWRVIVPRHVSKSVAPIYHIWLKRGGHLPRSSASPSSCSPLRSTFALPVVKIFPWHRPQFSGSVYDGRKVFVSLLCHLMVVILSVSALYVYRRELFGFRERSQESF
jgi:hypothetical protein